MATGGGSLKYLPQLTTRPGEIPSRVFRTGSAPFQAVPEGSTRSIAVLRREPEWYHAMRPSRATIPAPGRLSHCQAC